jgi:L-fuconate dehydratase
MFDYIAISGTLDARVVECVNHLHEHFLHPAVVRAARYVAPTSPGYSIEMRAASLDQYEYPGGAVWTRRGSRAPDTASV